MQRALPEQHPRPEGGTQRPHRRRGGRRWLATTAVASVTVVAAAAVPAGVASASASHPSRPRGHNEYVQTNLVSDLKGLAQLQDANLKNPWGLALGPTTPVWVSDNATGVATLYSIPAGGTSVSPVAFLKTVTVPGPRPATGDGSSPTGQVFNPTPGFVVTSSSGSGPAPFIFDSESGRITAWNPMADPIVGGMSTGQVEYSSPTAVYKGLTIATGSEGTFLYASNFHDGTVDVFNSQFQLQTNFGGGFKDPFLPPGYAPFGIQVIHDLIYVSYAKQNSLQHDDVAGPGHGFIDIYTLDGYLLKRLASRGALNSPWGMALAPATGFGRFSAKLLVGNFGDGRINVFDPFSGRFLGQLQGEHGRPITIDGLWALKPGTASTGGTSTVLFSAGLNGEQDGLLGSINADR
jgi:uncharacterized protein (TIGR03118 family)